MHYFGENAAGERDVPRRAAKVGTGADEQEGERMSVTPEQLAKLKARFPHMSEATVRLNSVDAPPPAETAPEIPGGRKRIRQNSAGLNRTEQAYLDHLKLMQWTHIYREPSLPLCNGVKYKVDFLVVGPSLEIEGHEVKGRAYSTGIVKLKIAASLYPWITFRLVTKTKTGWKTETVLP